MTYQLKLYGLKQINNKGLIFKPTLNSIISLKNAKDNSKIDLSTKLDYQGDISKIYDSRFKQFLETQYPGKINYNL